MKNLIVLAVAAMFATNAVAAEMKWTGSAGWRYSTNKVSDGLDSKNSLAALKDVSTQYTKTHAMRANLGVMGGWENVEYGFGMRTGGAGRINTDYATMTNGGDQAVAIELAWFRYVRDFGSFDIALTVGRQKSAFVTDSQWETLFDNDVRWDGFGWNFKFGMFGLNASQYILGAKSGGAAGASTYTYTEATDSVATTNRKFQALYSFQPYMNWKFSDDIEAMFAVAYHKWVNEGQNNLTGGGVAVFNTGTVPAIPGANYKMDNKSQWDILANVTLPYNLNFVADYVKTNKAQYNGKEVGGYTGSDVDVSATAWALGLTYGKLRKAHDFTVGYSYGTKGIASVVNTFTKDNFLADNKGHTFVAGYSIADNFHLGFKMMMLQEKERLNAVGGPGVGGAAFVGVNAPQHIKTNYMELTTGVAF